MGKAMKPIKDTELEYDLLDYLEAHDKRIFMFYLFLRYTGFRASDVIDLKVRDVKDGKLRIREKKTENRGNKEIREIPIHPDLNEVLKDYLKGRQAWEVLFPSQKGRNKHLSYTQAYRILKDASEAVGIKDFGTHSGRKTCAYHIYMNTGDLKEVQNFLMHDNKRDTIRYVGIEQEVRNNTVKNMNSPLASRRKVGK